MKETVYFFHMFSDYEPPEPLYSALSQAAIVAADLNPEGRFVSVALYSDSYIPGRYIDQAQQDICEIYGLRRMEISATHPADQLTKVDHEELISLFMNENTMTRGSLAGATWNWNGNTLTIWLQANGKQLLLECVPAVKYSSGSLNPI